MAIEEIDQLEKIGLQRQKVFAYLSCERVYPNYVSFSNNFNFGDPAVLRSAIDFVYNSIFNEVFSDKELEALLVEVDNNAPRPDDFAAFYASIAMYSAGVIYESLNLLKQADISRVLSDISSMSIDAVDLFIQERDDMDYNEDDFEAKILNDPLMQEEMAIQKGTIAYLHSVQALNESDIKNLLHLQEEGTGTLKIM
jgi:uncharacterized protein YjaG (DUF416 family)